jgi:phosphatidylglycerophosphate synthase
MFDPVLRPVKERVVYPVAKVAARFLSPLALTSLGLVLGVAAAVSAAVDAMLLALGLWLLSRLFDGLDGVAARILDRQSDLGGYLDLVMDSVSYAAIPVAMALRGDAPDLVASIALLAVFYVNIVSWTVLSSILEKRRARSEKDRLTTVAMPSGIIEGTETIVFFTLFLLIPGWYAVLAWIMVALTAATVGQRIVWATRTLTDNTGER